MHLENSFSLFSPLVHNGGWKDVPITYGSIGQIELSLNKGDSLVHVYWIETGLRRLADIISVVTIILVVYLGLVYKTSHVGQSNKKS
jgi:hypothetical protein